MGDTMTLRHSIFDPLDNSPAPVPSPDSWVARRPPSPARDAAYAAIQARARRIWFLMVKERAVAYEANKRELDMFSIGTSRLSPRDLVIFLKLLDSAMRDRLARVPIWGGEVPAINLRGAMLYARAARYFTPDRIVRHLARRAKDRRP